MELPLTLAAMTTAMGALLLLLLGGVISIVWLSPAAVRFRLQRSGFRGPSPTFPFGNLTEMRKKSQGTSPIKASSITHDIHSTVFPHFARWRETYGKVFIYWLGTEPFLYIGEPEFLKQVTSGPLSKKWGKPNVFKHDRWPMFGNGLAMADGGDWALHRHIISPAFSPSGLNPMIEMMAESTSKMLEEWSRHIRTSNQVIDVERGISQNAAEIIAITSFGISQEGGKQVFTKLQAMQSMLFNSKRMVGVPFSKLLNPMQSYKEWKLGKEIDQLLLSNIDRRRKEPCKTDKDLLGLLLEGNGADARLTAREMVDECKTFFFGGQETTALALTWTLLLLALYPEWQEILREEIMEVCCQGDLEYTTLTKLTKMGWVLKEVLRLYSPAPNAQRQAREDIRVGDIIIPRGTNLWIDVVGMHHDVALWGDNSNEFKPERFKKSPTGGCKHRMGFLPFGFGGRICVGRDLALIEYKIVLSLILRKFSFSISPTYIHSPKVMFTLRPSCGLPLTIHLIDHSK